MDMKLELVFVPVTDVDRARDFYVKQVGFRLDHDEKVKPGLRFVQLTPVGSACSIAIGEGLNPMPAGSQKGLQVVVKDAAKTREMLVRNGVEVTEIDDMPWGRFCFFKDPDENAWTIQQLPPEGRK
jgi:catechol 2,3-dioxygenase-like lactoylglutathione lyase family enzyme